MAKQAKTPFETVTSQLGQLTRSELSELADMVAALLDATDDDQVEDEDQVKGDKPAKPAAKGHIEAKMIGKNGPYLYLRFWAGKTLKSKYIGKAKAKE